MTTNWQDAVDGLRAHYGMPGPEPKGKPPPVAFHHAFLAALETKVSEFAAEPKPFEIFCQLPVLLLINGWDHEDFLVPMMAPKIKGLTCEFQRPSPPKHPRL